MVERDRQDHLAGRQDHRGRIGETCRQGREVLGQFVQTELGRVDRHQHRPDALDDLDHAVWSVCPQRFCQEMDPDPDSQVEFGRARLDQQVPVAGSPDRVRGYGSRPGGLMEDSRAFGSSCSGNACDRFLAKIGEPRTAYAHRFGSFVRRYRLEVHGITWPELAEHPPIGLDHHRRYDESAERRAVLADDDRGVTGEHDAADRVGGVVQVGRMQACLAAVLASPAGSGADQADAGAVGAVVDLPGCLEELLDALVGEVIGCTVRAGDDPQHPVVGQLGEGDRCRRDEILLPGKGNRVVGLERATFEAAESAEGEGGAAAEDSRNVQAAFDRDVPAHSWAVERAHVERRALGEHRDPAWSQPPAIDGRVGCRAADTDESVFIGGDGRPGDHTFQAGCVVRVADGCVEQGEGEFVDGA